MKLRPVNAKARAIARRGRPPSNETKVQVTLRVDEDVIGKFKADGPGWQTRINKALRKAVGLS